MTTKKTAALNASESIIQGEIKLLREAVTNMDALSQTTFDEIAAISRLAGDALESDPEARIKFGHIINALKAIRYRADGTMNDINVVAEQVGCNFRNY